MNFGIVQSSIDPLSVSNSSTPLLCFLDGSNPLANGVLPANNTSLPTWTDKSKSSNNATQATGATQPIFKTNALAGKSVVNFSGVQWMDTPSISWGTSDATLFIVVNKTGGDPLYILTGAGTFQLDAQTNTVQVAAGSVVVGSYALTSTFVLISVTRTGANAKAYLNGVQSGATLVTSLSNIANGIFVVGTRPDRAVPLVGNIAEVALYKGALSDEKRQAVEFYFKKKWGIS